MSAASEGDRWSPGTELFPLTVGRAVSRVRQRNRSINAFITTRLDEALADAASRNTEPGARSPLHGVPYGLKDEWETAALRTTAGSYRHRERVPRESSPVHTVFESAGAVLL